jgi:hypothetical protein
MQWRKSNLTVYPEIGIMHPDILVGDWYPIKRPNYDQLTTATMTEHSRQDSGLNLSG